LDIYVNNYKLSKDLKISILSILHIQLLLYKYHDDINEELIDIMNSINHQIVDIVINYNMLQHKLPNINIDSLIMILDNLIENDNIYDIIDNYDKYVNEEKLLQIILPKFNLKIEDYDIVTLDYKLYHLFANNSNIIGIKNKTNNNIYLVVDNNLILLVLDEHSKITEIWYNNYKTIPWAEITKPFKWFIPTNCFHLIYIDNNGQYNIIYFVNNNLILNNDNNILGRIPINKIFNIKISKSNYFLPDNSSMDDFNTIIKLYGYNKLNNILLSDISDSSDLGYIINKNEIDLIKLPFEIFKNLDPYSKDINYFNFISNDIKKEITPFTDFEHNILTILNDESYETDIKFLDSLLTLKKKIHKYQFDNPTKINELIELNVKKYEKLIDIFEKKVSSYHDWDILIINISDFSSYIKNIKIYKMLCDLKDKNINDINNKLKIYINLFNNRKFKFEYLFEYLFEFIYGYEILDEQYYKYKQIISEFVNLLPDKYNTQRSFDEPLINYEYPFGNYLGGSPDTLKPYTSVNIPIHHFMMGKGKSAVLTPLLFLYFAIVHKLLVYIIVPEHLLKQTHKSIYQYATFFNLENKIIIMSDKEIKYLFLYQKAPEEMKKTMQIGKYTKIEENSIMLIDEFDTIMEPTKNNFNIKLNSVSIEENIYFQIFNYIITKYNITNLTPYKDIIINETINTDLDNIKFQIDKELLVENIHWGIHPSQGYAIPYSNKDKPDLDSSFSSITITIFLTLYYYIVIYKLELNIFIENYIISNNILDTLFNIDTLSNHKEIIVDIFKDIKNRLLVIHNIIKQIYRTETQLNTTFVDILLLNNIYKIGYSGTLNINDIKIEKEYNKYEDFDEKINIAYAITNKLTNISDEEISTYNDFITNLSNFNNYSAFIDICGLFKNIKNEDLALKLHQQFAKPVIFIDELDNILYIKDNKIDNYNDELLTDPIFYYDQAHIIGTDIKQDNYDTLLGLCIINEKSKYTEVAQGMFRLRKLNLGHRVDFLMINKSKTYSKIELYNLLKTNDNIINKRDLFNFQTYKAIIRHNKSNEEVHPNLEKVKYKIIDNPNLCKSIDSNKSTISNLLENIIDVDYEKLDYLELNECEKIFNLIYNVMQTSIDKKKESKQEQNIQTEIEKNDSQKIIIKPNLFEMKILIRYDKDINYIDDDIAYHYVDNIYYLPNIFVDEYSGLAFVQFDDKLLLIPGHMIKLFIKTHNIYNIYLKRINNIDTRDDSKEIIHIDNDVITPFKSSLLFKIITYKQELTRDIIKSLSQITQNLLLIFIININDLVLYKFILTIINPTNKSYFNENKKFNTFQYYNNIYPISDDMFYYNKLQNYHYYGHDIQLSNRKVLKKINGGNYKFKNNIFKQKYIKYKSKYNYLKNLI